MVGLTSKKPTSVFRTLAQCYAKYKETTLAYPVLDHGWADVKETNVFCLTLAQCYANHCAPTLAYLMMDNGWADVKETNVGLPDVGPILRQLLRTNIGLPNVGPWLGRR